MRSPAQGRRNDRGFALLLVFALAGSIAIFLYKQLPRAAFEAQRSREELLIERGEQYSLAIRRYVRTFNKYPATLDDLENTNGRRFLRRRYVDPMTGKDEWRVIKIDAAGMLVDSKVQKQTEEKKENLNTFVSEGPAVGATGPEAMSGVPMHLRRRESDNRPLPGMPQANAADPNAPQPPQPGQQLPLAQSDYFNPQAAQQSPAGANPVGAPGQPQPGFPGQFAQPPQPGQPGVPVPAVASVPRGAFVPPGVPVPPGAVVPQGVPVQLAPGVPLPLQQQQMQQQPNAPPNAYPQAGQPVPGQPTPYPQAGQPVPGQPNPYPQVGQPYQPQADPYPQVGQPNQPQPNPYPQAGQPVPGQPNPYPQVGQPNQPQPNPYPQVGQPYQPQPNPYPQAGQPVPGQPNPYPQVGQPYQPQPNPYPQVGQPNQPQPNPYPQVGQPYQPQPNPFSPAGQPTRPPMNAFPPGQQGQPGAQSPVRPGPPGQPNTALDMIRNLLTQPRGAPAAAGAQGAAIGGGIAGVASKHEAPSIKIYKERQKYDEWEFVYDGKSDNRARAILNNEAGDGKTIGNRPVQNPGNPAQPQPLQPQPFPQQPFPPQPQMPAFPQPPGGRR